MVGDVWDYDSMRVRIMSGERRIMIMFTSHDDYLETLKKGLRTGASVVFDADTLKIERFI